MRVFLVLLMSALASVPAVAQTPTWIADAQGCRVSNPVPRPLETITWTGDCKSNLAQGRGTLQWYQDGKPGSRYDGEYRDGLKSGKGVFTFSDGRRYEGDFLNDKFHGSGVFTYRNGERHEGDYRDGFQTGKGVYTFPNGDRYEGEFLKSFFSGRGVLTFANGDRYDGEFSYGRPHGAGTKKNADGRSYTGTWTSGCFRQGDTWTVIGATALECGFR